MMDERSEIFIGLVAAVGSDLSSVQSYICELLSQFNYNTQEIKISDFFEQPYFIDKYSYSIDKESSYEEILSQMEAGKKIRKESGYSSVLAQYAIQEVKRLRSGNGPTATVYIFRSLKHPEEAKLLSEIYGVGYYQIGVYSDEKERISYLRKEKDIKRADAYVLVDKDIAENESSGQQTRDTFQLSDFFIAHGKNQGEDTKLQLKRIFDLIFGNPHITPTIDEHMMYMAYSYATRSADLSRQVGATLSNQYGDIIGLGSNDVPKAGGGPYWPNPVDNNTQDWRDYRRGEDANHKSKNKMIIEIMRKFGEKGNENKILEKGCTLLEGTGLFNVTEFARATHAEMSAILNCARNGINTKGSILYCTTFPCHNCAKHIIESGIAKVLFVEPYPKSQAEHLHDDAISFQKDIISNKINTKIIFSHFIGVAARRYLDLFSLKLGMGRPVERKDKETGDATVFEPRNAQVRVPLVVSSYLDKEKATLKMLDS